MSNEDTIKLLHKHNCLKHPFYELSNTLLKDVQNELENIWKQKQKKKLIKKFHSILTKEYSFSRENWDKTYKYNQIKQKSLGNKSIELFKQMEHDNIYLDRRCFQDINSKTYVLFNTTYVIENKSYEIRIYFRKDELPIDNIEKQILISSYMKKIYFMISSIHYFIPQNKKESCSNINVIHLILSNIKKGFFKGEELFYKIKNNNDTISCNNVNSGFSYPCSSNQSNIIVVYRRNEWDKVLIHELIHCLGIDFSYLSLEDDKIKTIIPIQNNLLITECYDELLTLFIHSYYNLYFCNNISIETYTELIVMNHLFSLFQSFKILNYNNIDFNDLLTFIQMKNEEKKIMIMDKDHDSDSDSEDEETTIKISPTPVLNMNNIGNLDELEEIEFLDIDDEDNVIVLNDGDGIEIEIDNYQKQLIIDTLENKLSKYNENSNVFCYYILKSLLLFEVENILVFILSREQNKEILERTWDNNKDEYLQFIIETLIHISYEDNYTSVITKMSNLLKIFLYKVAYNMKYDKNINENTLFQLLVSLDMTL